MAQDKDREQRSNFIIIVAYAMTTGLCVYHAMPWLAARGANIRWFAQGFAVVADLFKDNYAMKTLATAITALGAFIRTGKRVDADWGTIAAWSLAGRATYLFPSPDGPLYVLTSLGGLAALTYGLALVARKLKGLDAPDDDEGFMQNTKIVETNNSINMPYKFLYKKQWRKGWINVINPYRASIVLGTPGSGKSFTFFSAFIEQCLRKDFTMFCYDYKFPSLTLQILSEIAYQTKTEGLWKKMKKKPHIHVINFDDPMKSHRCNPINHTYITDPADTSEIADLVFRNINKGADSKGFDFFNESAKVYLDALIWYLANYDPDATYDEEGNVTGSSTNYTRKGSYCTFPHVIEMMATNYERVFQILQFTKGLEAKIGPFSSALEGGAQEQLQGQIASAQIPMAKFVSPALYWVMTGNDFTLDINDPDDPKIVCVGNNPDRQSIYGTTLALYTSRMFKLINHKGKLKSVVMLDELPTVFIKGLDNLIATARSNKVAILLGAQDKSQLRRDYGDKEAEVIFTTVGNLFSGAVEGQTAKDISATFGKMERKRVSQSQGDDSQSMSISYQEKDLLPPSKIVEFTPGTFCGWVKDDFGKALKTKKFYGSVSVDRKRNEKVMREVTEVPYMTKMFGDTLPHMSEAERQRMATIHPELGAKPDKLYEEFLKEKRNEVINANFRRIKDEVKQMVDKEFERTKPIRAAWEEANGKKKR